MLLVDGDASGRTSAALLLSEQGLVADVAATGGEAVVLAQQTSYPAAAIDLGLEGSDGVALIRGLHAAQPQMVFVVLSDQADIDLPAEPQFRDSVVSVVHKPSDVGELAAALHRAVRLAETRSDAPPALDPAHPDSVLLVEDTDLDACLVEAYLSATKYEGELTRVPRLSDALALLREASFGVIVADLTLPDARGLDAVLRIQNLAGDTPLIVMSGLEDESIALQAVQAGAQDFLLKGSVDETSFVRSLQYARERKRAERCLARQAHFDGLTDLPNRARFKERLAETLARSRRSGDAFAVMFVDLDQFKPINDQYGHAAGDEVLVSTARRLQGAVREYDTVARLGGDEFAVIVDQFGEASEVTLIADRILDFLSRPIAEAHGTTVTASIGIAFYPDAGTSAQTLLDAADKAMYDAKERGRNTFTVFQEQRGKSLLPMLDIGAELKEALGRDEFVLHYQPLFDVRHNRVRSAEALLRWHRSGQRLVPPAEFLPILESTNDIVWIGAWVIRTACRALKSWRDRGVPIERVSVNVSVRQLDGDDLVHTVSRALDDAGLSPDRLVIEITESSVMEDPEGAQRALGQLKQLGVGLAIDDFGTGYSSLSYLYRMPFDTVKLDQSFTRDLEDPKCRAIAESVVALATQLKLTVVAEGVETPTQRAFLEQAGCDVLQGFLFSRGLPGADLEGWLEASTHAAGASGVSGIMSTLAPGADANEQWGDGRKRAK